MYVYFFKQKTADEMRISDWSSDVCSSDLVSRVGDAFERELIERGMAGADTALAAQDAFGLRIEHARYLTVHDLAAMTALQYEHAGLAALWPLLDVGIASCTAIVCPSV